MSTVSSRQPDEVVLLASVFAVSYSFHELDLVCTFSPLLLSTLILPDLSRSYQARLVHSIQWHQHWSLTHCLYHYFYVGGRDVFSYASSGVCL